MRRARQSGNVMLALFAAVGAVGVIGATGMNVIKGPVRSMHHVTQKTIAENSMVASTKLAVMATANQPNNGDCDGDNTIEPIAWSDTGTGPKPAGAAIFHQPLAHLYKTLGAIPMVIVHGTMDRRYKPRVQHLRNDCAAQGWAVQARS